MSSDSLWDAQRYQFQHGYVWRHGEGLVDLLAPQPGERIVDLGCGSGQLTARIAESGADVIGLDRSPEMIAQARTNFPSIDFRVADATAFQVESPVDAVFSNAALHWVKDANAAIGCVWRALKPGGRFVLEMGGHGNTRTVLAAVREVAGPVEIPWFFPTIGEYAAVLEANGFEIRLAMLFDRPTIVEGERGLEDWLVMFGDGLFSGMSESQKQEVRRAVAGRLRPTHYRDGQWTLDYRRLRVTAAKSER
ncbi:MAG TPA: methyltransferase domain-containing protein [Bryobacteraceae bacterium]|nr:methyltransferase domain-containing protein [Bryobacteraceae bacterium]